MTWWRAKQSKQPLGNRIDRWLTVMALSLEGLGWPTAADLWLAELSRPPDASAQAPDAMPTPSSDPASEGDPT
ncbi:MAG TPA: hypothetical protein VMU81_13025 [Acetobacteraceae bacterium]|nr:hypothetical protein [Acetobacteraceae bacterium]